MYNGRQQRFGPAVNTGNSEGDYPNGGWKRGKCLIIAKSETLSKLWYSLNIYLFINRSRLEHEVLSLVALVVLVLVHRQLLPDPWNKQLVR